MDNNHILASIGAPLRSSSDVLTNITDFIRNTDGVLLIGTE